MASLCGFVLLAAMYLLDEFLTHFYTFSQGHYSILSSRSHICHDQTPRQTHTLRILISLRSKGRLCNPSRPSSASYLLCFQRELCSKPCCSQNISETLHGRLCIMNSLANTALKYILMHEF